MIALYTSTINPTLLTTEDGGTPPNSNITQPTASYSTQKNALGLPPIDSHGSQYGVRGGVQGVQVVPSVRVIQPT